MILYFISVMWKVCLNGLLISFSVPMLEWEQGKVGFFHNWLRLILVRLLVCLLFRRVLILDVELLFHSRLRC